MKNDFNIHNWQAKYLNEGADEVTNLIGEVTMLTDSDMEAFLYRLAKYFQSSTEELTNMNAKAIGNYIEMAALKLKNRSGN